MAMIVMAFFLKWRKLKMANVNDIRVFGASTMDLGGRERRLQFDMNAYAELENLYGSIDKAMEQLQKGSIKDIRTILWVGLIHEEAVLDEVTGEPIKYNITPYQVGGWIKNTAMLKLASEKLGEAMAEGMPADAIAEAEAEANKELSESKNA